MDKKDEIKKFKDNTRRVLESYTNLYAYQCKSCGVKFNLDIIDDLCYSCHCYHTRLHHVNRDSY